MLCDVLPSGTLIGEVHAAAAAATGLPEGTPVVLGGHDHLCGVLPVGAFRPGVALDVTGTWETVIASTPQPVLNDALRQAGMTVQAHVVRDMHAVWGGNVAGEMVEWYRRQLAGSEANVTATGLDWDTLIGEAAATQPGAGGVLFLPHMSGTASPVVDSQSLGVFAGLTPRASRGDMLRAIIEGLDYQFLDMVLALEKSLGTTLERFIAVGGATRNTFWMQNKADVVGRPIEVHDVEEATPLGAAILAGIGVGLYQRRRRCLPSRAARRPYLPARFATRCPIPAVVPNLPRSLSGHESCEPPLVQGIHDMNGQERILSALRRETPDAVPTFEWFIDATVGEALVGSGDILDIVAGLDLDGVNLRPNYQKRFLDDVTFVDEWGITRQLTEDTLPALLHSPIPDITRHRDYAFPDPDAPQRFKTVEAALQRFGDEKAIVLNLRDGFSDMRDLLGYEGSLMNLLLEPTAYSDLLQRAVDYNLQLGRGRQKAVRTEDRRHDRRRRQRHRHARAPGNLV